MDGDSARATTISANRSGCDVESVSHAGRPLRSCPIGSHRRGNTLCAVDRRRVSGSPPENPLSKPHRTAKIPTRLPDPSTLRRWAYRRLLSLCCWAKAGARRRALFTSTHHPCLGSRRGLPYSADRGKQSVTRRALDELKQQIPLLEYLQAHDWQQARPIGFGRFLGLCPLHADHEPSFLVDPNKNLFYCYGCRRGGDIIRFVELYHQVKFPEAVALLHQWRGLPPLLHEAASFYRMQLHRHAEAVAYLYQRGIRSPEADRAHADRLRARWLPARLADAVGLPASGSPASRFGDRLWATTPTGIAWCFRWKRTSMAAACLLRRHLTVSCRAPRVACTHGTRSGYIQK